MSRRPFLEMCDAFFLSHFYRECLVKIINRIIVSLSYLVKLPFIARRVYIHELFVSSSLLIETGDITNVRKKPLQKFSFQLFFRWFQFLFLFSPLEMIQFDYIINIFQTGCNHHLVLLFILVVIFVWSNYSNPMRHPAR